MSLKGFVSRVFLESHQRQIGRPMATEALITLLPGKFYAVFLESGYFSR
jgi:hypothetical protein